MLIKELLNEHDWGFDPDEEEKRDYKEIQARRIANQSQARNKYIGKLIRQYYGGYNGRPMPDDVKKIATKHVKKASNGSLYINEYDPSWYPQSYKDPTASFNTSVMGPLKPYFTVQNIKELK
jgi:hypothetical protein